MFFFFSSRRRHTRYWRDWSSDVCSSDLLFMVEFSGDTAAEVADRVDRLASRLSGAPGVTALVRALDPAVREPLWGLRRDRKRVVSGKGVDLGGRRILKTKRELSPPALPD